MIRSVCVYCSSSTRVPRQYYETAGVLGRLIAENGYSLVYGGGNLGLMGEVARAAKNGGGRVTGIIIKKFHERGLGFTGADRMIVVESMDRRKRIMCDLSDAFISIPGGFGTLDELFEVISLKQLHFHNKPVVIVNTNNFFDELMQWVKKAVEEGFIKQKYRELYYVAESASDCVSYIKQYIQEQVPEKWG